MSSAGSTPHRTTAKLPVGVCQPSGDAFETIPEDGLNWVGEDATHVTMNFTATPSGQGVLADANIPVSPNGPMLLGQSVESALDIKNTTNSSRHMTRFSTRVSRGLSMAPPPPWVPRIVVKFVRSQHFECVMAIVILGNCFCIGVEADNVLEGAEALGTKIAEHVFTVLFVVELLLRIVVYGYRRFIPCLSQGRGNIGEFFDAILVIMTGVIPLWVLPFCGITPDAQDSMRMFTVLRALRLARVVRVLRSQWFQEVWVLLRGMIESMRMLFWTVVVIAFITYIFAIFGVVTISTSVQSAGVAAAERGDERMVDQIETLFGHVNNVASFMMTLVQVLTLDSWTDLVRRLNRFSPRAWIFFYLYVSIAVLVLMNIVTAVLVDNALMNSNKDAQEIVAAQEQEKKKAFQRFRMLFGEMDTDGSGDLTREEFQTAFADPVISAQLRAMQLEAEDVEEIFTLLDSGDGVLSLNEFFDGIQRMEGVATAKDLFRLIKKMDHLATYVNRQTTDTMLAVNSCLSTRSSEEGKTKMGSGTGVPSPCASRGGITQPSNSVILQRLDALTASMAAYDAKVDKCLAEIAEVRADLNTLTAPVAHT
mmetsp:Transcript_111422/g.311437  ORF Transcript_111422/g.311437 Transcript_111422/m.311437 type:complete len:593 (-) Transcript_111422:140-1918(-)